MTHEVTHPNALTNRRPARLLPLLALALSPAACSDAPEAIPIPALAAAEAELAPADVALVERILDVEDARAPTMESLRPLTDGLRAESPWVRRLAARAVGRLEREFFVRDLAAALEDRDPGVRAEAANALAQSVTLAPPDSARAVLLARLSTEPEPAVRAAIAQSLGRLAHRDADAVQATSSAIAREVGRPAGGRNGRHEVDARIAKGLYLLARQPAAREALADGAVAWLRNAARSRPAAGADEPAAQRTRAVALAALATAGRLSPDDVRRAAGDPHPLVRREAMLAAPGLEDAAAARRVLERGLDDAAAAVRIEALRSWGRAGSERILSGEECGPILHAARDEDTHVALQAIQMLPLCPTFPGVDAVLDSLVFSRLEAAEADWHRPAHALVSLSVLRPEWVGELIPSFSRSENPFVRAYAARAAAASGRADVLHLLALDPDPNVRHATLEGLQSLERRGADDVLIAQLAEDDPQLLLQAALLLAGTEDPRARPALVSALDRLTALGAQTSRSTRLQLLERIGQLGTAADTPVMTRYLRDFDPAVASRAADFIGVWTGERPRPEPQPLPRAPVPSFQEIESLDGQVYTVELEDGGRFSLRLRAWEAPTNAARFARLADAGYYDGLTYHRVVPNFVIQGGSPAANEYAGDGPFTRDELGLDGNWRGTVGLSTRGRDTGDAQMYINLVDNVRLDHNYTVFAEVVEGMEVVDGVLEGARILRISRAGPS